MCVMIAFYTLVFMIFMSDAICIARFMVCFYLGYFVGAMCRKNVVVWYLGEFCLNAKFLV